MDSNPVSPHALSTSSYSLRRRSHLLSHDNQHTSSSVEELVEQNTSRALTETLRSLHLPAYGTKREMAERIVSASRMSKERRESEPSPSRSRSRSRSRSLHRGSRSESGVSTPTRSRRSLSPHRSTLSRSPSRRQGRGENRGPDSDTPNMQKLHPRRGNTDVVVVRGKGSFTVDPTSARKLARSPTRRRLVSPILSPKVSPLPSSVSSLSLFSSPVILHRDTSDQDLGRTFDDGRVAQTTVSTPKSIEGHGFSIGGFFSSLVETGHFFCLGVTRRIREAFHSNIFESPIFLFFLTLGIPLCTLALVPGSHNQVVIQFLEFCKVTGYWIGLGFLSSCGMGSGLHTFVLFLGPWIAKVTLAASTCTWSGLQFSGTSGVFCLEDLSADSAPHSLWDLYILVFWQALMWGFGTAIGELPPYFLARAARLSGQQVAELAEIESDENHSFGHRLMKGLVHSFDGILRRPTLAFFFILLMASIPNPLFDLAGITCGYSLTNFWIFFGATSIGKALVKASLQAVFVITIFGPQLKNIEHFVEKLPFGDRIAQVIEKQRSLLHQSGSGASSVEESSSWIGTVWNVVITLMLVYFVVSTIQSVAEEEKKLCSSSSEEKELSE